MASSKRSSSKRPVFQRDQDGEIDPTFAPKLIASDGKLNWELPDDEQRQQTHSIAAIAPEPKPPPLTEAEQALIAANRARVEELKSLPRGIDELELGDLLRVVTRHSGADIGLSVAGLALQVAGIVPVALWESVMVAAGVAGFALRHKRHDHAQQLVLAGSDAAEQLWTTHPEFVMATVVNILHSIAQAAAVDDTDLEDRLDAYYPHWSRTDFEFDLRRYLH